MYVQKKIDICTKKDRCMYKKIVLQSLICPDFETYYWCNSYRWRVHNHEKII